MEVFVARQPIFNKDKEVVAYELLYRDGNRNFFDNSVSSSIATSILLVNSYFSIGISNLVGQSKAFVNFDKELIHRDIPMIFNKDIIAIELIENIVVDQAFLEKIKEMKAAGYTIVLDDFVYDYPYKELVELCDIIKVDMLLNDRENIKTIIDTWNDGKKTFLAEKVENDEVFRWALEMGFQLFQGYFFSKPVIMRRKKFKENSTKYIQILQELNCEEPSFDRIANVIEYDVGLTYKLLRLVNSKFTLIKEVHSIKHALAILGLKEIERWISLIMVQEMGNDKPSELVRIALLRSKLGELLALHSSFRDRKYEVMLMGLMSIVDAILETPMEEVLKELPLSEDIKNTMLGRNSVFFDLYQLMLLYERGLWEDVGRYAQKLDVDDKILPELYFDAIKWADELMAYMDYIH
ncbi:MAG: EAL and HDOD domain-containing protein [Bacillota bacterium]